jgi:glycosyltransferase involved in cell wall biosynthesis
LDILIEAFQILLKKIPTAILYIIGEGSMKQMLKKKVLNNKLENNIIFINGIPREEIWYKYFKKFRYVVIPRPRQNNAVDFNMSIKLVESLASGKPIITTDIPAMKGSNVRSIFIIKHADPVLLSNEMEMLSNTDEETLIEYSKNSILAAENYDIRGNIIKLISAFTKKKD